MSQRLRDYEIVGLGEPKEEAYSSPLLNETLLLGEHDDLGRFEVERALPSAWHGLELEDQAWEGGWPDEEETGSEDVERGPRPRDEEDGSYDFLATELLEVEDQASADERWPEDPAGYVPDFISNEEEIQRIVELEKSGELAPEELFQGPFLPALDERWFNLEELGDEEVFGGEALLAQQEWQAFPSIHAHFQGKSPQAKFASYLELRDLYRKPTGASNPARWIADNIVTLSFFGRRTPGHRDLRGPLAAAVDTLQRQGHTPQISKFYSFVPRKMRTSKRLSNHALGRAIDINHPTNPHVFNRDEILVIRQATGVDLGQRQEHDVMRRASREFQRVFKAEWLRGQPEKIREATARRSGRLANYARAGFLNLDQPLIDALIGAGFTWGGDWRTKKDFMHFELPGTRPASVSTASGGGGPSARTNASRVVQRNRYWSVKLGWLKHYDDIARALGFTNMSPTEQVFAEEVRRWQRANGLTADGVIGPNTWNALKRLVTGGGPAGLQAPSTRPSPGISTAPGSQRAGRWGTIVKGDFRYQVSDEDVLWAKRMVVGEGADDWQPVLWCMTQRLALHADKFHTFTDLIQKYSQPINPRWRRDGKFCVRGGKGLGKAACEERRLKRRDFFASASSEQLRAIGAREAAAVEGVERWARGEVANPVPGAVHFAVPSLVRRKLKEYPNFGPPAESKLLLHEGKNWFMAVPVTYRWPSDHVRIEPSRS